MILEYPLYNESICMIRIEAYVLDICYQPVSFSWSVQEFLKLVPAFKFHHRAQYCYSHAIQAFAMTLHRFNLPEYLQQEDITPLMLEEFTIQLKQIYFSQPNLDRQQHVENEQHNRQSLGNNLETLIKHYAKLLFIRVDLYFSAHAQVDLTIHRSHQYLQILLNRLSNRDGCFQDLHWWAWALEQGAERGYHIHLLLVYDGHRHQQDEYLALQVGHYWKDDLTGGEGEFYTANQAAVKARYRAMGCLGIGMIHRDHPIEVANALAAAAYLVNPEKDQQMLRVSLPKMRTFGTAQLDVKRRRGLQA